MDLLNLGRVIRIAFSDQGRKRFERLDDSLEQINAWARECAVSDFVRVSGSYTQEEAVDRYHASHILLHTKFNDPCPRVVVEALACGLPVVYSASGGVPEQVGLDAGVGVPAPLDWHHDHPPPAEALASAVEQIVGNYACYAKAARARAERLFDVRPWVERHAEVFRDLML